MKSQKPQRIVLTGAPSSGKSSTMKELVRVYGNKAVLVPESAVVLLSGGFPAPMHGDLEQIRAFQRAIVPVQWGLETVFSRQNPEAELMVFDRGALDGAGFWPPGPQAYFKEYGLDQQAEFKKFDHVLFMELPTPEQFGGVNALRFHDYQQSLQSEKQLREAWQGHPGFREVKACQSIEEKVQATIALIGELARK
jgi:predicted ATPase